MAENLNQFTKFDTYSSYSKLFDSQEKKHLSYNKNPLEYYTKRNLELPKYVQGENSKVFDQINQTSIKQPSQILPSGSIKNEIHRFANDIDKLCHYANSFLNDCQHRNGQPKQKLQSSKSPESPLKSPKSALPNNEYEQFKQFMNQNTKEIDEQSCQQEFKQYLEFKNQRSQVFFDKQDLQLKIPNLDTSAHINPVPHKKRTIKELYQRTNKNILSVEEKQESRNTLRQKTSTPVSLSNLNIHQDEEIQKALQVLVGRKQ